MPSTEQLLQDSLNVLSLVDMPEGPETKQDCANIAQVYALVAIAQELLKLNEQLGQTLTDVSPTTDVAALAVRIFDASA